MLKLIVKYEKKGYMKYLGHLEMVRLIERVLRRVDIPFDYSKGYNPKPQIAFAAPLAVGVSSQAEYFEVKVLNKFDIKKIENIPENFLPDGIKFLKAKFSEEKKSIMAIVKSSNYLVKISTTNKYSEEYIREKINNFLKEKEILWKKIRKRKKPITKNILPLILKMLVLNVVDNQIIFKIETKTGSAGNLKPEIAIEKFLEYDKIEYDEKSLEIERLEIFREEDSNLVSIL